MTPALATMQKAHLEEAGQQTRLQASLTDETSLRRERYVRKVDRDSMRWNSNESELSSNNTSQNNTTKVNISSIRSIQKSRSGISRQSSFFRRPSSRRIAVTGDDAAIEEKVDEAYGGGARNNINFAPGSASFIIDNSTINSKQQNNLTNVSSSSATNNYQPIEEESSANNEETRKKFVRSLTFDFAIDQSQSSRRLFDKNSSHEDRLDMLKSKVSLAQELSKTTDEVLRQRLIRRDSFKVSERTEMRRTEKKDVGSKDGGSKDFIAMYKARYPSARLLFNKEKPQSQSQSSFDVTNTVSTDEVRSSARSRSLTRSGSQKLDAVDYSAGRQQPPQKEQGDDFTDGYGSQLHDLDEEEEEDPTSEFSFRTARRELMLKNKTPQDLVMKKRVSIGGSTLSDAAKRRTSIGGSSSGSTTKRKSIKKLKSEVDIVIREDDCRTLLEDEMYDDAMIMYDQILTAKKKYYGEESEQLAYTYRSMGNVESILVTLTPPRGSYDQALAYYQKSLEIFRSKLGDRHDDVTNVLADIGDLYYERDYPGDRDLALEAYTSYLAKIKSEKDVVDNVFANVGELYLAKGEYDNSVIYFEKAIKSYGNHQTAECAVLLLSTGICYQKKGDHLAQNCDDVENSIVFYKRASDRFFESIEIFERKGHKDMIVHTKHNIGYVHVKLKSFAVAFQCYREIIGDTMKSALGNDKSIGSKFDFNSIDPVTRSKLLIIVRVLLDARVKPPNAGEALVIIEDVLKLVPTTEAHKVPNYAEEMSRLNKLVWKSHRAVEFYEKQLVEYHEDDRCKKDASLTTIDPVKLFSIVCNLAHSHFNRQHYSKAFGCYEGAMQIVRMYDVRLKAGVAFRAFNNMGFISYEIGDYLSAVQYYKLALDEHQPRCGVENSSIGTKHDDSALRNNIGNVLVKLNQYKMAIECYELAVKGKRKLFGARSQEVAGPLINLASVYVVMGKTETAISLYEEAYKILKAAPRSGDQSKRLESQLGHVCGKLGKLYMAIGKLDESRQFYNAIFNVPADDSTEKKDGNFLAAKRSVEASLGLGKTHYKSGNFDEALRSYRRALGKSPAPVDRARLLKSLANTYARHGYFDKSLKPYREALQTERKLYNEGRPVARTLQNIGNVLRKKGQLSEAVHHLKQSVKIYKNLGDSLYLPHGQLGKSIIDLGKAYLCFHEKEDAEECYTEFINTLGHSELELMEFFWSLATTNTQSMRSMSSLSMFEPM